MAAQVALTDCDGHIVESIPEMAEFMDPRIAAIALNTDRRRPAVFPSLDSIHYRQLEDQFSEEPARPRENASEHRMGSAEDWVAFLDRSGIEQSVMFTSAGLSVGFIMQANYAVLVCRAYNDYIYHRYRRVDPRLHPMALIPMQDVNEAVKELRRCVLELGLPGAMLPSRGLPLHYGHEHYWPVYEEAAGLRCTLGVHGGSSLGFGADTFTSSAAARTLRHPIPLALALVSLIQHGVFDRFQDLRVGFFEGGPAWVALVDDRMTRDEDVYMVRRGMRGSLRDYLSSGQILIGCEGNEEILPYISKRVGLDAFAFASDYPHEVDVVAANKMVEETLERADLTQEEKAGVLGGNAKRFYRL